jgi:DNA polymerase III psi subunit
MSISKRQFSLLKTMGIAIWQRRSLLRQSHDNDIESTDATIDLASLCSLQLFNDILLFLNLTAKDVSVQSNQLSIGGIQWRFSADSDITMQDNYLQTPTLSTISTSTTLKRALWAELQQLGK